MVRWKGAPEISILPFEPFFSSERRWTLRYAILAALLLALGASHGITAEKEAGVRRTFKAPFEAVWAASCEAWDTLHLPARKLVKEEGLLVSDTIPIPGDTAKSWMADAEPESWWQEGHYILTLRLERRPGNTQTKIKASLWIWAMGVPHAAMVSLRPRVGRSKGILEKRVLDEISLILGRRKDLLPPPVPGKRP
jgi:hypothetical protein